MSKSLDLDMEETVEQTGLFSPADTQDIETLERSQNVLNFNIMCSQICFKHYKQSMSEQEASCHDKCFNNLYSTLMYCQRKIVEANLLNWII